MPPRRNLSISRAPPPTPIATGRGLRTAAVDDRVFSEYLDTSLRVPELSLPQGHFPSRSSIACPDEVGIVDLLVGDDGAVRQVLAAAAEAGGVVIVADPRGGDDEGVRAAIGAALAVFETAEEEKKQLGGWWFGQGDGAVEEFYWHRLRSPETERMLNRVWPQTYPELREKMENVAARLESVAECIAGILSKHIQNQTPSKRISKVQSLLCLRKHDPNHSKYPISNINDVRSLHSHALNLHICSEDREFCILRPEGSAFFTLHAGSILVTIGKSLQEWCNGEIRSASGEIVIGSNDDPNPFFSLEYMCSPPALSHELDRGTNTLSIMDQLLIFLVLHFLYSLWTLLSS